MPSRDVEINLVAHDRTGHGTRSAARNLEQLARKVEKTQKQTQKIKTKVDVDRKVDNGKIQKAFGSAGKAAGKSFRQKFREILGPSGFDRDFSRSVKNIPNLFGAAGRNAGAFFRKKFGPAGFDQQFTSGLKRIPKVFSNAGTRAKRAFRKAFTLGPAGLDPHFVADTKKIGAALRSKLSKIRIGVDSKGAERSAGRFANRFSTRAKKILGRGGRASGAAFMAGLIKTVTFGQLGQGFAHAAIRAAPAAARLGGTLGVAMAGALILELGTALSAAVPLALGGLLLAPSVVFLLRAQTQAMKQIKIQDTKVAAIKKQIAAAKAADARASGRSGDSAKAKQARQDHINDLKKTLLAEQNIRSEYERQAGALNQLKARAKSFLTFVSEPVKVPLTDALIAMGDGFDRLKGPFREFTAALGPALVPFANGVMNSLGSFLAALKPTLPSIVAGFQEWGRVLPQITGSIGTLLGRLAAHPEAVQQFADSFDTLTGTAGDALVGLQNFSSGYGKWEALIRGGRTGQWGDEWTKTGTKVGFAAKKIGQAQLWILRKYDDMLQGMNTDPGSPLDKMKNDVHQARLQMEAEFAAVTAGKKKMDVALSSSGKTAIQLKADDTDLTAKIINAKKQLKTVKGTKARARIEADISGFRLARRTVKSQLHLMDKTTTKPKLKLDAKALKAGIADINRRLKDKNLTNPQRTKLKADKRQASATLRQLQGEINQLHGKKVDLWIKTHRVTYYSSKGSLGTAPTNPKAGSGAPGSSGLSWGPANGGGMLNGGGMSRTGGPAQVNVAAPEVNTRVFLDSREIRSVARSTVLDENRRNAYRARVGARR